MTPRPLLVAGVLAALLAGAPRAHAASVLCPPEPPPGPDGFACAACPPGAPMGFRQFALRGATVEAPDAGVLAAASVYAKRIAGAEDPRIAILRPAGDD